VRNDNLLRWNDVTDNLGLVLDKTRGVYMENCLIIRLLFGADVDGCGLRKTGWLGRFCGDVLRRVGLK
jgi:hypothetical protein